MAADALAPCYVNFLNHLNAKGKFEKKEMFFFLNVLAQSLLLKAELLLVDQYQLSLRT